MNLSAATGVWSSGSTLVLPWTLAGWLDSRWQGAGLVTLIRVLRHGQGLGGESVSEEVSYFVSNQQVNSQLEADALFDAIRQHWRIEAMYRRRGVSLQEDALRTGSQAVSWLMSSLRTLALNFLQRFKPKNMVAQLEGFTDNFSSLLLFMTQQKAL